MTILIAKANEEIIKGIHPTVKFTESTKNTSTFAVKNQTFQKILDEVKLLGYNPYALMAW
jgi:hypothetical protein